MKPFISKSRSLLLFSLFFIPFSLFSCQESWQERAVRETREMSIRQCPHYLTPGLIVDSLSFNPVTLQRHTYYTFVDSLIDTSLVTPDNMLAAHQSLAEEVRGDMGIRTLKKHGVSFHYHYRLQSDGRTIYTDSVTASEY